MLQHMLPTCPVSKFMLENLLDSGYSQPVLSAGTCFSTCWIVVTANLSCQQVYASAPAGYWILPTCPVSKNMLQHLLDSGFCQPVLSAGICSSTCCLPVLSAGTSICLRTCWKVDTANLSCQQVHASAPVGQWTLPTCPVSRYMPQHLLDIEEPAQSLYLIAPVGY
jgi:hypothetical protein